jgi:uncharacterized protein (TIGR03067 family)
MKRRVFALAVLAVAAAGVTAADDKEDANKKDLQALQGTWQAQSITENGQDVPAEEAGKLRLVFAGSTVTILTGEDKGPESTFTLDATNKPATMDIKDKKSGTTLAIYRLEADVLTICFANPGETRPKEFASKRGAKQALLVFKRSKK